ncbi:ABC-type glycerol-3-phosphate transport system substrate-binding protein [Rhodoferax ferrireducens]|uniref:ABC-type glycerol-3-phosphate transport system substrate-binding protein n=1 Tax=Rhodoferax ferrireducens TaxID=192843 RepID=A0ABU2C2B1_9BURK|nr:extracellular solute-binding protein [Rhodoferax ferrireducens]MDR7375459.1 ABC-type glycerol-3-phosphate transport system substrate-binding protein [Rhodoferax ferrireducens]
MNEQKSSNMNEQQPVSGTSRRTFVAGVASAAAVLGVAGGRAFAQTTETITYNTFLDPGNQNDPRAVAQTQMIAAFEVSQPRVKVRVVVDPSGQNGVRAARSKADSPDVIRVANFQLPEFVSTGSILSIDELVARDKVDTTDWLISMDQTRINGKLWGLQQDYRIPIFVYRKSKFEEAKIVPPRTYEEVAALGPLLTKQNQMAYAVPIGASGGIGGAQALVEFMVSSIVAGNSDPFFVPNGREIGFSEQRLQLAASTVKDLFTKKAATPVSLQFAYNEMQDGLRAGTIASATFGLFRYRGLKAAVANDMAWAPAPSVALNDKQTVYGFQLCINSNSPRQAAAWEFVKFMASPAAQAIAARGGEVVARASAYKDAYFKTPEAEDQLGWKTVVQTRGRIVNYSIIQSSFNQICGEAFQRMILRDLAPAAVAMEVRTRYADALAKS